MSVSLEPLFLDDYLFRWFNSTTILGSMQRRYLHSADGQPLKNRKSEATFEGGMHFNKGEKVGVEIPATNVCQSSDK